MSHVDLCLTDAKDSPNAEYNLGWDRPLCWIDSKTLGIGYNRGVGWSGETTKFPSEILIYDLPSNRIARRFEFDGFDVRAFENEPKGDLYFDDRNESLVCIDEKKGLLITDVDGRVVRRDSAFSGWKYNLHHRLLYRVNEPYKRIETSYLD